MKRLNDDTFKKILKSVPSDYDKKDLWSEIDSKLDKDKKRRAIWWFCLGLLPLLFLCTFAFFNQGKNYKKNDKQHSSHKLISSSELQIESAPTIEVDAAKFDKEQSELAPKTLKTHQSESKSLIKVSSRKKPGVKKKQVANNQSKSTAVFTLSKEKQPIKSRIQKASLLANQIKESEAKSVRLNVEEISFTAIPTLKTSVSLSRPHFDDIPSVVVYDLEHSVKPLAKLTKRQFLQFSVGGGLSKNNLAAINSAAADWKDNLNTHLKDLYQHNINLLYGKKISQNISLIFGTHFSRQVSKFNYESLIGSSEMAVNSDSAYYHTDVHGVLSFYEGETMQTIDTFLKVQHYNHRYELAISGGLQLHKTLSPNLELYGQTLFRFVPWSYNKGKLINESSELVRLQDLKYSGVPLQVELGLGLNYKINQVDLLVGFKWIENINTYQLEKIISNRNKYIGMEIGVRKLF